MKKIILFFLCMILNFTISFALDSDFKIENGVLIKYTGTSEDIVIPEGVISIGYNTEYSESVNLNIFGNTKIRTVTLPQTLQYIGCNAFKDCGYLQEVKFNSTIKNIGRSAFENCKVMRNIDISTVEAIEPFAFYNCVDLSKLKVLASTVKNSTGNNEDIFKDCTIKDVEIIGEITIDERNAEFLKELLDTSWGKSQNLIFFNNCLLKYSTKESSVSVPNNVIKLGHNVFDECYNMRNLTIPKNVKAIYVESSKLTNCNLIVEKYSVAEQYAKNNNLMHTVNSNLSTVHDGMSNFIKVREYTGTEFNDVNSTDWFYKYVKECYELGLINGKPGNRYGSQDNASIADVISLAAKIHSIYNEKDIDLTKAGNEKWYMPYLRYAESNNIYCEFDYYSRHAMRKEIVQILAGCLPEKEWEYINNVTSIPDVNHTDRISAAQKESIFKFFNSGILAGNNEYGIFYPGLPINRAELSTIISKILNKSLRGKVNLLPSDMVVVNGNETRSVVDIDMNKEMPKDLSIEDITVINDNKKPIFEYKENGEIAHLSGKFSDSKVENAGEAIEMLNSLRGLLKIKDAREEFVFDGMDDSSSYRLQKVSNGIEIKDKYVILIVNKRNYPIFVLNSK